MDGSGGGYLPSSSFDRYARMVRHALGVPTALVSLVEPHRQVFVGALGLPDPWQESRETPLSHSFCQYVVADRAPLVVPDAREDDRLRDNLAIPDLGVVAYAGFPVLDRTGTVVGSLCAIDGEPRQWRPDELAALEDLAAACSAELAQRQLGALADARLVETRRAVGRTELLLALSDSLTRTTTLAEVVVAAAEAARTGLGCARSRLWLRPVDDVLAAPDDAPRVGGGVLVLLGDGTDDDPADLHAEVGVDVANPWGRVMLTREPVLHERVSHHAGDHPRLRASAPAGGARAFLPLDAAGTTYGVLELVWDHPQGFGDDVQALVTGLAGYCALAVQRALLVQERMEVAEELQRALLPVLPQVAGVRLGSLYRPASVRNEVGGDWFDAQSLPDGSLAVVVGDVVGHDVGAAAAMGRLRNILGTLLWDRPDRPPAAALERLDQAWADLGVARMSTLLHGRLAPPGPDATRRWEWSNAGHLSPLLVPPQGPVRFLDGDRRELLVGLTTGVPRSTWTVDLEPGSTVLLCSDGLVESRHRPLRDGLELLRGSATRHRHLGAAELVPAVAAELLTTAPTDDVVLLALTLDA